VSVFQHPVIIDAWVNIGLLCFGGCTYCGNCRRNCNKLLSLLEVSHSSGLTEKEGFREGGLEYRQQLCARWSEHHSAVPARNDPAVVLLLLLTDQSVSV